MYNMFRMKILIIGASSYIGNNFLKYAYKNSTSLIIDTLSIRDNSWLSKDFSLYDAVIYLSALVHKKEKLFEFNDYIETNVNKTFDIAKKAIHEKVKHFVFMSTIGVYGKKTQINENTLLEPYSHYGKSKKLAEEKLTQLFKHADSILCTLRCPMVYGLNSKGNPKFIEKLASLVPFFLDYPNKRSFISVENLCTYLLYIINNQTSGIIHPENMELMTTFQLFKYFRDQKNKKTYSIRFLNPIIYLLKWLPIINKIFGDSYFDFKNIDFKNIVYSSVK